jgi:hypothetical protein
VSSFLVVSMKILKGVGRWLAASSLVALHGARWWWCCCCCC